MHILMASRESRLATYICRVLSEEHHRVDLVQDSVSAFDRATSATYDIIVLYLSMPSSEGMTLCQGMRVAGIASSLLMVQAHSLVEDRVAVLNAGADDVLSEPFAPEELLARVNALVRRHSWDHAASQLEQA